MEIKEMVDRYNITLGVNPKTGNECIAVHAMDRAKKEKKVDEIKAHVAEIKAYLKAEKEEEDRKWQERKDKINAIPGLKEIKAARLDLERWHDEFEDSFRDVGGLGVRAKPQYDFAAMYAQYPRAVAYLKAEAESNKNNYRLSAIGKKALEEVIYGDYQKAIETMEEEIKAFVEEHACD